MRKFRTLLGRELGSAFHQPLAYVVLFFFLLITGFNFHAGVSLLNRATGGTTMVEAFFNTVYFWFPFLLVFPLITMRVFAEEAKLGTVETLMTAPVRDVQVVFAKYFGALAFYLILWLPSLLYFVVFQAVTDRSAAGAAGSYLGAYAMILLLGMLYTALGCLASALTDNQIVAAVMAFAAILGLFFLSMLTLVMPSAGPLVREIAYYFSPVQHMMDFSRGIFDSRPVVFYLTSTALALFATFHVFQYRRWKS
jgi:ABC-2 type transport system permease protein